MLTTDNKMYNRIISGIATVCNNINKIADNTIKIYRILFPFQLIFLNFKENIGISATKKNENKTINAANRYLLLKKEWISALSVTIFIK